jgi:hypothetical protein
MGKRKTFAEKHPDADCLQVDFLGLPVVGVEEQPLVFLTQWDARGKAKTLIFHLDIALKTFPQLTKKLREYNRLHPMPRGIKTRPPEGMNGPKTADGRYGRLTEQPEFDEFR